MKKFTADDQVYQIAKTIAAFSKLHSHFVNIGSIGGRIAQPLNGPYCISKSALAAATEALRYELSFFGMWASLVEPGAIKTPIWDKVTDHIAELSQEMSDEAKARYGAIIESSMALFMQTAANASEPELVARAVHHALTAKVPRSRYLVGSDARRFAAVRNWTTDATWDWMVRNVLRSAADKASASR